MKRIISLIIITLSLTPSFGQYSQNIDTLSRKEIRRLILNQEESKKAKSLIGVHQGAKFFSVLSYSLGALLVASGEAPKNDQEANIGGIMGFAAIGVGVFFTLISEVSYFGAVEAFKKSSSNFNSTSKVHFRNSDDIYNSIYN